MGDEKDMETCSIFFNLQSQNASQNGKKWEKNIVLPL